MPPSNKKKTKRDNKKSVVDNKKSTIDNKKDKRDNKKTSGKKSNFNLPYFGISVLVILIIIVIHFSLGGVLLYASKLAQSNILPTDQNCFPYTDVKPTIDTVLINIFNVLTSNGQESAKIQFPYNEENAKNSILDMFRNYKNQPNSNFLANYFISIIESLICFNYATFNTILNTFNANLSESFILLLGPVLVPLMLGPILLMEMVYFIYLWVENMKWFFKVNTSKPTDEKANWQNITFLSPVNYGIGIWLVTVFLFLLFMVIIFALPVLPVLATTWCIFSILGYTALLNNEEVGIFTIIKDVFKNFKKTIMAFFSLCLVCSAFLFLGNIPGYFSILTVVLMFFGVLSLGTFSNEMNYNVTPLTGYEQAKKVCTPKEEKSIASFLTSFFKGGGDITKELKNLNKKIAKNSKV